MRDLRTNALPVFEAEGEFVGIVDLLDLHEAEKAGMAAGLEPEMVRRVRGEGSALGRGDTGFSPRSSRSWA